MRVIDRNGKVDEDRRFYASTTCQNTFPSKVDGQPPVVCGRSWCTVLDDGRTVCIYCEQERPEAMPPLDSPLTQ